MDEAVKKLKDEMEKAKDNPFVQLIGNYLLQLLETNPATAEKIVAEKKTISGSLDAMKSAAQKKAVKGMAMLTDEEGYTEVRKYYGIEGSAQAIVVPAAPVAPPADPPADPPAATPTPPAPDKSLGVDLDDLLAGFGL
ncbi:Cas9 inhibitor AcrIIA9 family protein [Paenibacillus stellifer]|uniref:Cas9 inhibitor AcrIIA9 family protein n=1 Tax=Paenibacillus stellifer TaxID=169760 RepID=UPI000689CC9F|nr:Cas9 inhibitor AcrIIA9 family protein [Paenibacillus stellifer]